MSCHGNNATPPGPAEAPGVEGIDPRAVARELGERGPDRRLTRLVPGFDAPFFQAGLAGYSDAAMRITARRHGAPMCVTEALLDRMLLGGGRGFDKADLAKRDEELLGENLPCGHEDHPLVGQIIGSDPEEMAASALKMMEQGRRGAREYRAMAYGTGVGPACADTRWRIEAGEQAGGGKAPREADRADERATFCCIDVNLACPVKKIDRKSRGGHWLSEPEGAKDILRAVRAAVPASVPCSVKLRRGYDDTPEMARNFEAVFNAAYELGYAWTTVHARTVEQRYVGPSRWTFLRDLCQRHPDKVVFGSGDVWDAADIFRMIGYTGVAAVSVARGAIGNPWVFRQARHMMAGKEPSAPTLGEQRRVLRQHFELSVALHGERHAGRMMRKFGIKFARHHPREDEVKMRMAAVSSTADWLGVLDELYRTEEREVAVK
ncbi:MAG: tRNA dihydrouridine synthase [Phycisphaerales bacterium]